MDYRDCKAAFPSLEWVCVTSNNVTHCYSDFMGFRIDCWGNPNKGCFGSFRSGGTGLGGVILFNAVEFNESGLTADEVLSRIRDYTDQLCQCLGQTI